MSLHCVRRLAVTKTSGKCGRRQPEENPIVRIDKHVALAAHTRSQPDFLIRSCTHKQVITVVSELYFQLNIFTYTVYGRCLQMSTTMTQDLRLEAKQTGFCAIPGCKSKLKIKKTLHLPLSVGELSLKKIFIYILICSALFALILV